MSVLSPKPKDLLDLTWPVDVGDVPTETTSLVASPSGSYDPSPDELAALDQGLDQLDRGEFASKDRVARALSSLRR